MLPALACGRPAGAHAAWRVLRRRPATWALSSAASAQSTGDPGASHQKTLLLPRTSFPMRADAVAREPLFAARCTHELYRWQDEARKDREPFVLHDGPPYANGRPHLGHALNRVLKDFVLRYELMRGRRVHYMPGWDCHGLPIELKALGASPPTAPPLEVRRRARDFALASLQEQCDEMRTWGLLADLDGLSYRTLDPSYEASQLRVFAAMVERGLIYRAYKPVYWSPATRTALAEAELEYRDDHVSTSVHVAYPLAGAANGSAAEQAHLLIWTTTPWTLPANRAVAVHPAFRYVLARHAASGRLVYVAADRLDALAPALGLALEPGAPSVSGAELVGRAYVDPFAPAGHARRVIAGEHVTGDAGTGLVHTAPAHGLEDYVACRKAGVPLLAGDCIVDEEGRYTRDAPAGLAGRSIFDDGRDAVLAFLRGPAGGSALLGEDKLVHRYPYDWRARQPVVFRATEQWFCRLDGVAREAAEALRTVDVVPRASRNRLEAMLAGRVDWCISRQRVWGVPIPVFYAADGQPLMTAESIAHVARVFEAHPRGLDAWWELPLEQLLPPSHASRASEFQRGSDTMDVWFDSGTSWATLLRALDGDAAPLSKRRADVYLEGSDQHRGWFQSSLLTSVAARGGVAPFARLITHGFVLDEHGRKMSKSLGNVIEPHTIVGAGASAVPSEASGGSGKRRGKAGGALPAYGADTMRMWVASSEYTADVTVGPTVLQKVSETLRKLRNTCRFMLGNLHDFEVSRALPHDQLLRTDRYMLHLLHAYRDGATRAFEQHHYNGFYALLAHACATTLSGFYFEAVKGRLYTHAADSRSRRAAQTTLLAVLHTLTRTAAPVAVHLAEEVFDSYRSVLPRHLADAASVAQLGWPTPEQIGPREDAALVAQFELLLEARARANRELDAQRKDGRIGSSQEAVLTFTTPASGHLGRALHANADELPAIFGVSAVAVRDGAEDALVVARSSMDKCPRCWNHTATAPGALCGDCAPVVAAMCP